MSRSAPAATPDRPRSWDLRRTHVVDAASAPTASLRSMVGTGTIAQPGSGRTAERLIALADASRRSLSDGRLFEAHADGQSILVEAGWSEPETLGLLGVWASAGGPDPVRLTGSATGQRVSGTKVFCSGAPVLDHALVTADADGAVTLVLIDLHDPGVRVLPSAWTGLGMRGTRTASVELVGVAPVAVVGEPGWYLDRPGFWHGAVGVAASWFGGAISVVDTMRALVRTDDAHALAHLGDAVASMYAMESALDRAATEIDADPHDRTAAHRRALQVRRLVADGCLAIVGHAGGALGPRPLAFDGSHAQRVADLEVYVRQDHGRRDSEALGRLVLEQSGRSC